MKTFIIGLFLTALMVSGCSSTKSHVYPDFGPPSQYSQ